MGHTRCWKRSGGTDTVHPHIRGAYGSEFAWANTETGSSPHTWGIRSSSVSDLCSPGSSPHTWGIHVILAVSPPSSRFIPTYVGHTSRCQKKKAEKPVHPHIRGAYILLIGDCAVQDGSSPHTWGIQALSANGLRYVRFIPTYVGHTRPCFMYPQWGAVHPHIRGAYTICPIYLFYYIGSSPHTWGIRE